MAGKTFPGIGDLEDESPPVDPADAADSGAGNSRPFYSGPTVVDDLKVEEGLKKLRSLDAPPGPLTGITKAVVDALDSAPIDVAQPTPSQVVAHQMRETAVGRNVVGPTVGQQEIPPPFDDRALRGTLFGHSIHAPEFALPSPEEPTAGGALSLVDRGAPTTTVAVYHPQPTQPGAPPEAEPFERSSRFRSTPLTPIAVSDAPSRKKVVTRVAIGAALIVSIVGVAFLWAQSDGSTPPPAAPPPVAAPTLAPPPVATTPPVAATPAPTTPTAAAAREAEPEPMRAAEAPRARPSPSVDRPATRPTHHGSPPPEPAAQEEPAAAAPAHHAHPAATHAERHHTAPETNKNGETTETPAPARPTHGKRAPEDDPDATMAPSIE